MKAEDARTHQLEDVRPPTCGGHAFAGAIWPYFVALPIDRDRRGDHDGQAVRLRRGRQSDRSFSLRFEISRKVRR